MSLKAKGLYALIESYINIPNFILYKNMLKRRCIEGTTAFETAWRELKAEGYLIQHKTQTEKGYFRYEYELLDKRIQTPKTHPLDNPPHGKGGVYNNTDSSNTDLNNTDIYIILPDDGHVFIEIYKDLFRKITKKEHVRVTEKQLSWIIDTCDSLVGADVTQAEFTEAATEHLQNLPKSNNGNIIAFLHAAGRYFEYDAVNQRQL